MPDINEPTMPAIPEAAIEAAAIALWNREGGGPDPVPGYIRHDAYATLAAALPHLSIPSAPAQAPGGLVERLALTEMILAHAEDPALAPVAAALSAAIAALSQEQRGAVGGKPLEWEDADASARADGVREGVGVVDTLIESLQEGLMTDADLTAGDRIAMRHQVVALDEAATAIRALINKDAGGGRG